eukprot:gnl/TRDRNA2_/TRDRNA2_156143_c0_seq1.p1 gnl/TRDRNA2_/TRDRNA2_156143_c0~~gnl/TRDRNA2_/TRDRNA2_156143_c0_seq1.p1  ORF type:complete len:150 (+),score=33.59 gnl/TRDRNA2_/TRDRNA2_156143_c0_seq1:29-478(+)
MLEAAAVLAPKLLLAKSSGLLLAGTALVPHHDVPHGPDSAMSVGVASDNGMGGMSGATHHDHAAFIWGDTGFVTAEKRVPTMDDVNDIADAAEKMGSIYEKAAAQLPSDQEMKLMIMRENARELGDMHAELLREQVSAAAGNSCASCTS